MVVEKQIPFGNGKQVQLQIPTEWKKELELLEEFAGRAGDVDSARDAALAVLDALYDAGGLGALGAIGALLGIHDLLAVTGLGDLCHC